MKVGIENVRRDHTSCNFCNSGELNKTGMGLVYPYDEVVTFSKEQSGLKATICSECLKELIDKTKNFLIQK